MRRKVLLSVLFIVIFAVTYLGLCYLIPGWRIKLEAKPVVYLIESVKSMALIKTVISLVVGAVFTFFIEKVVGGNR